MHTLTTKTITTTLLILTLTITHAEKVDIDCSTYLDCASCTLSFLNCGWSNTTQTCSVPDETHHTKLSAACWSCSTNWTDGHNATCEWQLDHYGLLSSTPFSTCQGTTCTECLGSTQLCQKWGNPEYAYGVTQENLVYIILSLLFACGALFTCVGFCRKQDHPHTRLPGDDQA
ncbi:MAG: hypothetical protein K0U52_12065 [Gammaproteobacteria bacterium]|nr:hypothetical protein [Gammaproteobacteria bacterium]